MTEDKGIQKPEIKSKEWSEIIAEQFSTVAWIKGLKIYFSIIGILGIWGLVASDNPLCGTIGLLCLIIAYSLNVNKSQEIDDIFAFMHFYTVSITHGKRSLTKYIYKGDF